MKYVNISEEILHYNKTTLIILILISLKHFQENEEDIAFALYVTKMNKEIQIIKTISLIAFFSRL